MKERNFSTVRKCTKGVKVVDEHLLPEHQLTRLAERELMNLQGRVNLTNSQGMQCITSMEIAEATGKLHKNVMRDIRNMEPAWEKEHGLKFEQMQIREKLPNNGYRFRNVYILTKLESLYVATKFNDEARARLVLRWADPI